MRMVKNFDDLFTVPMSVKPDLHWWFGLIVGDTAPIRCFQFSNEICADASTTEGVALVVVRSPEDFLVGN